MGVTVDPTALAMLLFAAALLVGGTLWPLRRSYDTSDTGRGNLVELPRPADIGLGRPFAFVGVGLCASVLLIVLRNPAPSDIYRSLVTHLVERVVRDPGIATAYTQHLVVIVPLSIVAFVFAYAVCLRSTLGRKAMIVLHAALALAASLVADALLAVLVSVTNLPLGPLPVLSIILHFLIAYLLAMRLALTTYQLPRPTQVPVVRSGNLTDNLLLINAIVIDIALVSVSALVFVEWTGGGALATVVVLVVLPTYLKFGLYAILSLFTFFGPRVPRPNGSTPPVTVIAPAYNEELNIVAWVQAIDVAAGRYGGQVTIIMCDDGSTDRTVELCEDALARCAHAGGYIVRGTHGGKSAALNVALASTETEIVIRHDTDCLMHEDAIRYTVPWFEQRPDVGLVGAFMLPKLPLRTWIDRMRAIELITGFGLPRLGFAVIDSQPCVPGNYTAFRRLPALALGGWVSGMFGEDIELTCNIARLGYRAVYDRRIWAYEDVPDTIYQLRMQRRRWNRGSLQNFARFVPFAAGFAGPRFWFAEFIRAARRLIMPIQFVGFVYLVALVFFDASPSFNVGRLLTFYVLAKLPIFTLTVLGLNFRRMGRVAFWYPLYFFFAFLKRFANLECMLSMPTRPVRLVARPRLGAPVEQVAWPGLRPSVLPED